MRDIRQVHLQEPEDNAEKYDESCRRQNGELNSPVWQEKLVEEVKFSMIGSFELACCICRIDYRNVLKVVNLF